MANSESRLSITRISNGKKVIITKEGCKDVGVNEDIFEEINLTVEVMADERNGINELMNQKE